jgi:hypothetical protein
VTYSILSPALREITQAAEYYDDKSTGLGFEFIVEFDATIARILDFPTAWSQLSGNYRHCSLQRFPYSVIYVVEDDHILVVSVFGQSREPLSWRQNL